jgi:hypothetical protein
VLSTTATGATCVGCSVCCSFGCNCIICGGGIIKGGIIIGGLNGGIGCDGGGLKEIGCGGGAILKI